MFVRVHFDWLPWHGRRVLTRNWPLVALWNIHCQLLTTTTRNLWVYTWGCLRDLWKPRNSCSGWPPDSWEHVERASDRAYWDDLAIFRCKSGSL